MSHRLFSVSGLSACAIAAGILAAAAACQLAPDGGGGKSTPVSNQAQTSTLAGRAGVIGSANGTGSAARFNYPAAHIVIGTILFMADTINCTIRRIDLSTVAVTTLAGAPLPALGVAGGSDSTDGSGDTARFHYPSGIATDGTWLYVADTVNDTIRQVDRFTGNTTTLAGLVGMYGSDDGTGGPAGTARFSGPCGIAALGTLVWVADSCNNTIRQIDTATNTVTTLAGTAGQSGSVDGNGAAARFYRPVGMATDGASLFVADWYNNTIRKIDIATGDVSTLAGKACSAGSSDGIGQCAEFSSPYGVTITPDGTRLFVADTGNNAIRQIVIASRAVTTIAGLAGSAGSADGKSGARYSGPQGIATDGTSVYVADTANHTLRRISGLH